MELTPERPYEQLEIEQRPTTSYKDSLGKSIVEYLKGKRWSTIKLVLMQ